MPKDDEMDKYGESLAKFIKELDLKPTEPTDPKRFGETDLLEREASYGKAGFAMQFMLSTQLSDMERFPLKVRDLIIMSVDNEQGPLRLTWGPLEDRALNELPNAAMRGDRMYPPMNVGDVFSDFSGTVMSIDPSGRGADETGYAVVKMLNGYLYVVACGGLSGGYDDTTLTELSHIAKKYKVNHVVIESNFGDGMFMQLLQPVLGKIHPVLIEEVRHSKQKERRIIDTLEPVMMRHKLVFDPKVIEEDYRTAQKYEQAVRFHKMLIYQMTRITTDKGSLRHDDRLDALSMAVGYYVEQMNRDEVAGEKAHKQDLIDLELRKFMDNASNPNKVKRPIISEEATMFTSFR
jgi:Holliday junction resolvasome RuvABC endonuclease subunit